MADVTRGTNLPGRVQLFTSAVSNQLLDLLRLQPGGALADDLSVNILRLLHVLVHALDSRDGTEVVVNNGCPTTEHCSCGNDGWHLEAGKEDAETGGSGLPYSSQFVNDCTSA